MYEVISKKKLGDQVFQLDISAPDISRRFKPGQFVVLRATEKDERVAIPIADASKGSITLVFGDCKKSLRDLSEMRKGQDILDILGPLGRPNTVDQYGTVILAGESFGIAALYPIAKSLKAKGNKVVTVIGGRNKGSILWNDRLKAVSDIVHVCTDDGSMGRKGKINDILRELFRKRVERVYAIGSLSMMNEVCKYTYQRAKTFVNIYANVIDGIGITGSCRLYCGGEIKFVSCDGPEFDGHKVDFDELIKRSCAYADEDKRALRCK